MAGNYDATDGSDRMVFDEPLPLPLRFVFVAFGAMTFLAPWELLIRPGHPFRLGALPFWFISFAALSIGLPLIVAGLLGPQRNLSLDFHGRCLRETVRIVFRMELVRVRRFAELASLAVIEVDWSDGPSDWRIDAVFRDGSRPWPIRRLTSQAAAEALRDEILTRMGGLPDAPARPAPP